MKKLITPIVAAMVSQAVYAAPPTVAVGEPLDWDFTDPCDQRDSVALNAPNLGELYFVADISDLDGDGFEESAVIDVTRMQGSVRIVDGATGLFLVELLPLKDDRGFGGFVFPVHDHDTDGVIDIGVMSYVKHIDDTTSRRLTVFSSVTAAPLARAFFKYDQNGVITLTSYNPEDLNSDSTVSITDVVEATTAVMSGSVTATGNLSGDGIVAVTDVLLVNTAIGNSPPDLSLLEDALNDAGSGASSSSATYAGIFDWIKRLFGIGECAQCLIDCESAYSNADDCRERLWEARCDCWDLPQFDQYPCFLDVRLNFMQNCIQDVADAAGACAQCILDCHPLAP